MEHELGGVVVIRSGYPETTIGSWCPMVVGSTRPGWVALYFYFRIDDDTPVVDMITHHTHLPMEGFWMEVAVGDDGMLDRDDENLESRMIWVCESRMRVISDKEKGNSEWDVVS